MRLAINADCTDEPPGELPRPRIRRAAGLVWQRDDLRQLGMLRPALADDRAHVRRVSGVRPAVIALGAKGLIRHVAGEVVIVPSVMVARRLSAIAD